MMVLPDRGFRHNAWKLPPAFSKANDRQIARGAPRQGILFYVIAVVEIMRKGIANLTFKIHLW
jgi:hypothetical protein